MSQARIIKKYPNRRLYDTVESRYISLHHVRELITRGEPVEVIDQRTGENITRCVLLQVITEQESQGEPLLSEEFLARVIRCYRATSHRARHDALVAGLKELDS